MLLTSFLLLTSSVRHTSAQSPSNAGTHFTVCFPKNDLSPTVQKTQTRDENISLWLYISSANGNTCTGTIHYLHEGKDITQSFTAEPHTTTEIQIPNSLEIGTFEKTEQKGISITSDYPITVFGLSKQDYTSEAFLCYPHSALDTFSIASSFTSYLPGEGMRSSTRYSGFTLVGVNDSTVINIVVQAPLRGFSERIGDTITISLDKEETHYFVAETSQHNDVTGTRILSEKPISMFSSVERTNMPLGVGGTSRDCLQEQTPPVSLWGTSAIVTPHSSPSTTLPILVRIVAAFDNTILHIGDKETILHASEWLDFMTDTAKVITANKPILVSQFELAADLEQSELGDPFLAYIPSREQYRSSYTFISSPMPDFQQHFVNITVPNKAIASLRLDGRAVDTSLFSVIPKSEYSWASLPLEAGTHFMEADTGFGILVYGYGKFDSYGYTGGVKTEKILLKIMDTLAPTITQEGSCISYISVRDEGEQISGISSITLSNLNNITEVNRTNSQGETVLHLETTNPLDGDGTAQLTAIDNVGNTTITEIVARGFTVTLAREREQTLRPTSWKSLTCDTLLLTNIGQFSSELHLSLRNNIYFSVPPAINAEQIAKGDTLRIPVCFGIIDESGGSYSDILTLSDECGTSMELPLHAETPSTILNATTRCGEEVRIVLKTDSPVGNNQPNGEIHFTRQQSIIYSTAEAQPINLHLLTLNGQTILKQNLHGRGELRLPRESASGVTIYSLSVNDSIFTGSWLVKR